jgi:hypothetical protein
VSRSRYIRRVRSIDHAEHARRALIARIERDCRSYLASLPAWFNGLTYVDQCPLCGVLLAEHDQAACDAKMAAWRPAGLSPLAAVTAAVRSIGPDEPCPPAS